MDSREKINRLFFDKIKTRNLGQKEGLVLEIELSDYRIETSKLIASPDAGYRE